MLEAQQALAHGHTAEGASASLASADWSRDDPNPSVSGGGNLQSTALNLRLGYNSRLRLRRSLLDISEGKEALQTRAICARGEHRLSPTCDNTPWPGQPHSDGELLHGTPLGWVSGCAPDGLRDSFASGRAERQQEAS